MPSRFRDKGKSVMEEFIVGHDYDELKRSIDEWREPAKLWQVILDAVNMVFEKSDKQRQLLAETLVRLHADGTVHQQQILFALQAILEAYDVSDPALSPSAYLFPSRQLFSRCCFLTLPTFSGDAN